MVGSTTCTRVRWPRPYFITHFGHRCRALTHGQMIPAVQDFSQQQQLLDRSEAHTLPEAAGSAEDPNSTYSFKGEPLLTPQQLRDQLKASCCKHPSFLSHLAKKNPDAASKSKLDCAGHTDVQGGMRDDNRHSRHIGKLFGSRS
jgi:hypothetical protein